MSQIEFTPEQLIQAAKQLLHKPDDILPPSSAHGTAVPQETGDEASYDKTQLSMLQGMNLMRIHRDYLAHAIRYEFLIGRIKAEGEHAMVLDIGCADVPLMRAMRSSMLRPALYYGVDVRPNLITKVKDYYATHRVHFPFEVEYMDFTQAPQTLLDQPWTQVVCLEVIEHMPQGRGEMLLKNIQRALSSGGKGYVSTPVFDGKRKAKHHRYEWKGEELKLAIQNAGLNVLNRWGTFGNIYDLKKVLTPEEKLVWDKLSSYYGPIALSLIFSPNHPEAARNSIWEVESR